MPTEIPSLALRNGVFMPFLGFGTYKINRADEAYRLVRLALDAGYRHIDTAAYYRNEEAVGRAIRESGIGREDVFVTTKLWNDDHGFEAALKAFEASLGRLGLDYVDLYLVHWPNALQNDTWRAFEQIYAEGRAKAIGVSNFQRHHLDDLLPSANLVPMVNQMEFHPYFVQQDLVDFCSRNGIRYQARSPLMKGQVTEIPLLRQLAGKYRRSVAQIVLRWDIQQGIAAIPKSVTPERILENIDIFDFELEAGDMELISRLDRCQRIGSDPDNLKL